MATAVFEKWSCVRGYHVYEDMWAAPIGEKLVCKREMNTRHDIYVFTVVKGEVVMGTLTTKISRLPVFSEETWLDHLPGFRKTKTLIRFEARETGNAEVSRHPKGS